jgi:tripeptidyl-peptidase-1
MFGRFKKQKSTIFKVTAEKDALAPASKSDPIVDSVSGVSVDASCNKIITITCLQQLYNAVGFVPSANVGNSIGITGYLVNIISLDSRMETLHLVQEQFANMQDLQSFFADQRPDALNSSFKFISVNGS